LPSEIFKGLADANWKERLAAVGSLFEWLEKDMGGIDSEILVRYLSKKPGWKESNFQVSLVFRTSWISSDGRAMEQVTSKMYGIFQLLAEQSPSFAKASAALTIPALSDKLGDIKLKKPAGDALTVFAERSSLQFVLSQGKYLV
jgi:cytoskeleton-associated protein 5